MKINYEQGMEIFGIIGDPVDHCLSPVLHNKLFEIYGMSKIFLPIHVRRGEVSGFFSNADSYHVRGISVTMPHKQAVIPYCDFVDDYARASNSVNCIYWREDGLHGTTTDAIGLKRAIESDGGTYDDQDILFFGGGAVSLPILISMARTCRSITITNRTMEKAETNMRYLKEHYDCDVRIIPFETKAIRKAAENCTFVMNATSLGMHGMPYDYEDLSFFDAVPKDSFVSDIISNPVKTSFLKAAEERGLKTQNGLKMVIYQGFQAFYHFTGLMPGEADFEKVRKEFLKLGY